MKICSKCYDNKPLDCFYKFKGKPLAECKDWALKNLQLLPAKENMTKNAKLEKPFQPSFAFGGSL